MAIKMIGFDADWSKADYIGLSTDIKPLIYKAGSTFYETDTTNGYIYDGTTWILI
ncbi:hypothetical protein [Clostridium sp.]|uniref:hypothetical protein n=1 Tax=Clostridium sp. TaxID=1506 RepID=UPI001A408A01|nr:hypothetical protein [Clostridium sp.]MBK5239852.1 hypothetical protein [Clostridium sp.]